MKHINIYILLIGLSGLIFMSSCGEDAFSTTVELEQPEVEDRLVVNAFVTDEQQESLSVYVGRNVGILEDVSNWWLGEDDLYSLNDATVKLKKPSTNEVLDFEFNEDSDFTNFGREDFNFFTDSIPLAFFEGGQAYDFEVRHPDFDGSNSVINFPSYTPIIDFDFELDGGINEEGDETSRVTIRFQDQPDVKNYYEIAIYSKYDPMFDDKDFVFIYSSDLSHTRGAFDDNILLDDDSFDGTIKEIELKIERRNVVAPAEFYLEFRSINEGFYKYTKTLNQWGNVNDNPFASPVQIFSNVDQGLGVIALKNTDLVRIF